MGLVGVTPVAGFLEGFHGARVKGEHPSHGLALDAETDCSRCAILEGIVAIDHRLGDGVNLVIRFRSVSNEIRIGVVAHFDRLFGRDRGAAGCDQFGEERAYFLDASPAGLVFVRQWRPDDAARRIFEFARRSGNRRGEAGIGIVVDDALPHRAIACELDDLDVLLGEARECEDGESILVESGRPDHEADAFSLQLFDFRDAGIACDAQRLSVAIGGGQDQLQRLRSPFPGAEFEHAFLREEGAGSHRRYHGPARAHRRQARHIVAGRQDADIGGVFVLHHLADGDRDVEAGGAGVIGGERHGRRQFEPFGSSRR